MSYLDNLKSLRKKDTLAELTKNIEKTTKGGGFVKDERYFDPKTDKEGNASVTFRFLPPPEGEDNSYVKYLNVSFKAPNGKYFINKSPKTTGNPCPVYDWNGEAYAEFGSTDGGKLIQKRKSGFQHRHISNIVILKAENQPDDVGKVFLYDYGNQVFSLIDKATLPDNDDETKAVFDPFNPYTGANFLLKLKTKGEFKKNAEDSKFLSVSELYGGDDDKILEVCQRAYSLKAEVAADKFKTYAALKKELDNVLGNSSSTAEKEDVDTTKTLEKTKVETKEPVKTSKASEMFDDDEDPLPF